MARQLIRCGRVGIGFILPASNVGFPSIPLAQLVARVHTSCCTSFVISLRLEGRGVASIALWTGRVSVACSMLCVWLVCCVVPSQPALHPLAQAAMLQTAQ